MTDWAFFAVTMIMPVGTLVGFAFITYMIDHYGW